MDAGTEIKRHGNAKYDWGRYLDGQEHRLTAGAVDRTEDVTSIRKQIYAAAKAMQCKAKTRLAGRTVVFSFVPAKGATR